MMDISTKFKTYPEYKHSGVEWLGEIPKSWDVEKGKWLFSKEDRPIRKKDDIVTCFRDGEVTLRKNRRTDGFTNAMKEHGYQGIRKGDLVIHAMDAFAGAIGISDSDGKSTPVYSACTPRYPNKVSPEYYCYLLRRFAHSGLIVSLAKGIRERSTDFRYNDFAELEYYLPPLNEQIAIANFLDDKVSKIDEAIAQKEQLIQHLNERKQIIIQNAITKGLNPNAPMKDSGIEWISKIPEHWKVKKAKFLGKIKYGLGQPPREKEDGLPLIRATNVERGQINTKGLIFVDPTDIPWERDPVLKENDIIVVRSGAYTGDSARIPKEYEGAITGYDMVYAPSKDMSKFLSYSLLSHYVLYDQLYLLRMRAAQPHLNAEELSETLFILPSATEQKSIVSHIETQSSQIALAITQAEQSIKNLKEYKASLINSAVTGKIKVS